MTADQFRELLAELIEGASDKGLDYETIMDELREAVAVLEEALS